MIETYASENHLKHIHITYTLHSLLHEKSLYTYVCRVLDMQPAKLCHSFCDHPFTNLNFTNIYYSLL